MTHVTRHRNPYPIGYLLTKVKTFETFQEYSTLTSTAPHMIRPCNCTAKTDANENRRQRKPTPTKTKRKPTPTKTDANENRRQRKPTPTKTDANENRRQRKLGVHISRADSYM